MLVCIDDVQWSDAATLELVEHCLTRLPDLPMGWVLAGRPDTEAVIGSRLRLTSGMRRIELGPLSLAETRLLAEEILGPRAIGWELATLVFARAGGNPFLCEELLRGMSSFVNVAGRGPPSDDLLELVPDGVVESVQERSGQLGEESRVALEWGSVLPVPFELDELQAVADCDVPAVLDSLEAAGFLVSHGDRYFSFVHSILRDAVYRGITERERIHRHGAVADALTREPLERRAPQLANAQR
jgi:predicted ATPase